MVAINDSIELDDDLVIALTALFESHGAADGDFSGEQREWHLPRLNRAVAVLVVLFPNHYFTAMQKAESAHGGLLVGE